MRHVRPNEVSHYAPFLRALVAQENTLGDTMHEDALLRLLMTTALRLWVFGESDKTPALILVVAMGTDQVRNLPYCNIANVLFVDKDWCVANKDKILSEMRKAAGEHKIVFQTREQRLLEFFVANNVDLELLYMTFELKGGA
jgi:hypothetical protein